ncbi:hypothetical protein [Streptomyces johnsoniae]|uniref:YHS domain-containing protein n=1 Tax=Streptomyces johnsoniae TaxID=3075532 RepID=A0ABU2SCB9_9ACTN|nr:hypothetical protein [Streptomyces sp. DSM 41886]MDT0446627.1 hypothetical protein [Streptomyces sp. DSM 41886]
MLLIDVYVPPGVLDGREKQELGRRMIDALMVEDGSHARAVLDAQRRLTQVLVHEPAGWVLGDRPAADPADAPRYLVRLTVPAPWRKDMAPHVVGPLTDAIAATEEAAGRDPGRVREEPHVTVQLVGVSEGGIGLFGRSLGSQELVEHVTRDYRTGRQGTEQELPPGMALDPVCGMVVDAAETVLTLEHEGVRHVFCDGSCRRIFAADHGLALSR